ncbi:MITOCHONDRIAL FERREDOXIN 2 [Prunus dulcis]|uniref:MITOCHONDRIAL FERREDOXIN 2 n=1 Tax=Prunus dulcis TaxID=3755 RepID=A0A5H2XLQ3_PRUDU|nr:MITOCHONDRIAL FERREDOXIN 2 [Prunus dulcis]
MTTPQLLAIDLSPSGYLRPRHRSQKNRLLLLFIGQNCRRRRQFFRPLQAVPPLGKVRGEVRRLIMFASKVSRIGVLRLKQLSGGKLTSITRAGYNTSSCYNQYLQPLSETKLLRGVIFHKHHLFSTVSASDSSNERIEQKEKISVTFVDKDGDEIHIKDMDYYNKLEDPTDEENDMLDLAFGLTESSRLGCQVIAKPELDGIRLAIPAATRNFAVDGYVPKPH